MKKFIAGVLFGAILAVPTLATAQRVFDKTIDVMEGSSGSIRRFDDPDFQVKCWDLDNAYGGGVSCLPWSEVIER